MIEMEVTDRILRWMLLMLLIEMGGWVEFIEMAVEKRVDRDVG